MTFLSQLNKHQLNKEDLIVWALIPFREDGFFDDYYDWHNTHAELDKAFSEIGLNWNWTPTTISTVSEVIHKVISDSDGLFPLVLNYCDGDEINGFPGVSVVRALEQNGLAFTGADSQFYAISTSKIWMKQLFEEAGISTSPWAALNGHETQSKKLFKELGGPLFVKPSIAAGAWGLSLQSVVHDEDELSGQVSRLKNGLHGFNFLEGGIFVERFIKGSEFTVFLVGSADYPDQKRVYPPLKRIFHKSLPKEEQFVTYERNWNKYDEETPLSDGELIFTEKLAESEFVEMLSTLAWDAHCAVRGTGYSRVDIRMDEKTGIAYVLEVNANCSLSSPADDTSTGYVLEFIKQPFSVLIGEILADGLHRYFEKNRETSNEEKAPISGFDYHNQLP